MNHGRPVNYVDWAAKPNLRGLVEAAPSGLTQDLEYPGLKFPRKYVDSISMLFGAWLLVVPSSVNCGLLVR
jgi:hypothetical protein